MATWLDSLAAHVFSLSLSSTQEPAWSFQTINQITLVHYSQGSDGFSSLSKSQLLTIVYKVLHNESCPLPYFLDPSSYHCPLNPLYSRPSCCSRHTPSSFLPLGICTCCFRPWKALHPHLDPLYLGSEWTELDHSLEKSKPCQSLQPFILFYFLYSTISAWNYTFVRVLVYCVFYTGTQAPWSQD